MLYKQACTINWSLITTKAISWLGLFKGMSQSNWNILQVKQTLVTLGHNVTVWCHLLASIASSAVREDKQWLICAALCNVRIFLCLSQLGHPRSLCWVIPRAPVEPWVLLTHPISPWERATYADSAPGTDRWKGWGHQNNLSCHLFCKH